MCDSVCFDSFSPLLLSFFLLSCGGPNNIDLSESAASHELVMYYDDLTAAYESHLDSKHRQHRGAAGNWQQRRADRFIDQILYESGSAGR